MLHLRKLVLAACATAAGCDGDPIYINGGDGTGSDTRGEIAAGEKDFSTTSKIEAFLDGKVLTMEGADLPSFPNGFNEDQNFGQATQCYISVEITIAANVWTTRSQLGTISGASDQGQVGTCEHDQPGALLEFPSTAILVSNIEGNGACFDITATYAGFSQEGRGRISADGSMVEMEFYFKDQATGHRCADGDVGDATVTLNGNPFTGDSVQTYRVSVQ